VVATSKGEIDSADISISRPSGEGLCEKHRRPNSGDITGEVASRIKGEVSARSSDVSDTVIGEVGAITFLSTASLYRRLNKLIATIVRINKSLIDVR